MIHNYRLLTGNAESLHPSQSCILSQSIFFLLMVAILCKNSFWESKNICTIWENIHCVCTTKQSLMAEQIFVKHAILKLFFPRKSKFHSFQVFITEDWATDFILQTFCFSFTDSSVMGILQYSSAVCILVILLDIEKEFTFCLQVP